MTEEQLKSALATLKMLLGTEDDNSNGLLSFLLEDAANMILGYCRISILPPPLESLVPVIAADMYRAKGYGHTAAPEVVTSLKEGERTVAYADKTPDGDFLESYISRLEPFRNRKGRVPSELKCV